MFGGLCTPTPHPTFSLSNFVYNHHLFTAVSHCCESSLAPFPPPQLLFVAGYTVRKLLFLIIHKLVPKILEIKCHR